MARRLTAEEFIKRSRKVHGDRYNYSKVEYLKLDTYITIICSEHGEFKQRASNHVRGVGCRNCGYKEMRSKQRATKATFVEKAKSKHGDRYGYSLVNYVNNRTKVKIRCRKHGVFQQAPHNHLSGFGCEKCGIESRAATRRLGNMRFVKRSIATHGSRYDYSRVDYKNNQTKVVIVCAEHGEFYLSPIEHIDKRKGCRDCDVETGKTKLRVTTTDLFIEQSFLIHGPYYDYSLVDFKDSKTLVTIVCPRHGHFRQRPNNHLSGKGCPQCGGRARLSTTSFVEKAVSKHGARYDYSLVEYLNYTSKVAIICSEHGLFLQTPDKHLAGQGCHDCAQSGFNPNSRGELYYLAVKSDDGDTLYKIGITNFTVEERFCASDLARIRVLKTWRYASGRVAQEREAEILRRYAYDRYSGPRILMSGGDSELFTHDVLGLDTRNAVVDTGFGVQQY